MPAWARKEIFDPEEVGLYFYTSRCVRRAFLCGDDDYTGNNYNHRKVWMEEILQYMAQTLDQYLQLVDWTGPQVRRGKRGTIPAELADILQRLNVDSSIWLEGIEHFAQWFHRAAGRARGMMEKARERKGD